MIVSQSRLPAGRRHRHHHHRRRPPLPAAAATTLSPRLPRLPCLPRLFVIAAAAAVWAAAVEAHSRIGCPAARSQSTNIKIGPCGTDGPNDPDSPLTTVAPGLLTIRIDESVRHVGAPFRISLSQDGTDGGACTLLDHIPANPLSRPSYGSETSYTHYYVTVEIPDVACERCSLQLANPMTDKIGRRGWQNCTYPSNPGTAGSSMPRYCFSVYHSCADLRITGTTPRGGYNCPATPPPRWPYRSPGHIPNIYPQMTGSWSANQQQGSATGSWLLATSNGTAIDATFRRACGACAAPGMATTGSCGVTTFGPTAMPSPEPTAAPTTTVPTEIGATFSPTRRPTPRPTSAPTTADPTLAPTPLPTAAPTAAPSPPAPAPAAAASVETSSAVLTGVGIGVGVLVVVVVAGVVIVLRRGPDNGAARHGAVTGDGVYDNGGFNPSDGAGLTVTNPMSASAPPRMLVLDMAAPDPAPTASFDF